MDRPTGFKKKKNTHRLTPSRFTPILYHCIKIVEGGPTRAGQRSARINVIPSDFAHHGNRAEITHNLDDGPGAFLFLS